MPVGRHTGVAIGILVPEVTCLVARLAHGKRIHPGTQLAGGIDHQAPVVTDSLAHAQHIAHLTGHVAVVPTVNLEAVEPLFLALLCIVGKGLRRIETAR